MKSNNRLKKLTGILPIVFLMLVFNACTKNEKMEVGPTQGKDFTLTSVDGNQVKLADYENKVVVLFFFGYDCPSCKSAASEIKNELIVPFASRGDYQLIGLDQWDGNEAAVQGFKTATGLSVPLLLKASSVAKAYNTSYDRFVVIDQNGDVVHTGTKVAALDIAAVKEKVEMLLGGPDDAMMGGDPEPTPGSAPGFTLTSVSGSSVSLSDYENKVVVLFFLGNGCPLCISVAPSIESELNEAYGSREDYAILGLDTWNGSQASMQSFKTNTSVNFPLLLNASSVASDYSTTYDRLVVIDKNGNIAFSGSNGASSDLNKAKAKVNTLLGI